MFLPEAGATSSLYPPNFPLGAFHEICMLSWDITLYLNLVGGATEKEKQNGLEVETFKFKLKTQSSMTKQHKSSSATKGVLSTTPAMNHSAWEIRQRGECVLSPKGHPFVRQHRPET